MDRKKDGQTVLAGVYAFVQTDRQTDTVDRKSYRQTIRQKVGHTGMRKYNQSVKEKGRKVD